MAFIASSSGGVNQNRTVVALAFGAGFVLASMLRLKENREKRKTLRKDAGATAEGQDLSLYYYEDESLQPTVASIPPQHKFLPGEFYGDLVRNGIVCCVDILVVRHSPVIAGKLECLLLERGSEPARGVWWWPGGRMYKGESFFDTARRKLEDETGLKNGVPTQVLGCYNTFFPDSAWDTDTAKGTQTVNVMVLVRLSPPDTAKSGDNDILLDSTSERFKWIGLDVDEAENNGEDKYVLEALRRLKCWQETHGKDE